MVVVFKTPLVAAITTKILLGESVQLADLVGEAVLDAVDLGEIKIKGVPDIANCIRFRLDGIIFVATEDPDDGYRSSMDDIQVDPSDAKIKNVFPGVQVLCRMSGKHNTVILEVVNLKNNKLVLEVGTDDTEDYYPSFVSSFNPEAL